MNLSGIIIILVIASLFGRIVKSAQQSQAKRDQQNGQTPQIPYQQSRPQATSAHEGTAKPRAWRGVDSFKEMLERLEEASSEQQSRKDPAINFGQAFEKPKPAVGQMSAQQGEGMYSTQGMASSEGRLSTQGLASSEGMLSTQGMASSEGRLSTQGIVSGLGRKPNPARVVPARTAAPGRAQKASHAYFSGGRDLARAVIMSEVLGKPVSLRRRRAV